LESQSKQEGKKWNGTHQLRVGANGIDLLGKNLNTVNKSASLIGRSKEFGIAVNVENTKYVGHANEMEYRIKREKWKR